MLVWMLLKMLCVKKMECKFLCMIDGDVDDDDVIGI